MSPTSNLWGQNSAWLKPAVGSPEAQVPCLLSGDHPAKQSRAQP